MQDEKVITGQTEAEVWQQVAADINQNPDLLNYQAVLVQDGRSVALDIDIDLGGGFESGYASTSFVAPVQRSDNFKLALHEEDFLDAAGKFFGMQDVVIGYPDFDKRFIIKTNEEGKTKAIFDDATLRQIISSLPHFTLHLTHKQADENRVETFLELNIEEGITNAQRLQEIYHAFNHILTSIEAL